MTTITTVIDKFDVKQDVASVRETFKRASKEYPNGWLLTFDHKCGGEVLINYKMIVKIEEIN